MKLLFQQDKDLWDQRLHLEKENGNEQLIEEIKSKESIISDKLVYILKKIQELEQDIQLEEEEAERYATKCICFDDRMPHTMTIQ